MGDGRDARVPQRDRTDRRLPETAAGRLLTGVSAEVVGVCQRALEMTLEYVKDRKQFGVPVASFQAVSHRCAHMLLGTETNQHLVVTRSDKQTGRRHSHGKRIGVIDRPRVIYDNQSRSAF